MNPGGHIRAVNAITKDLTTPVERMGSCFHPENQDKKHERKVFMEGAFRRDKYDACGENPCV